MTGPFETPSAAIVTEYWGTCACPVLLKADPDIAGIGVIYAFLFSAALTVLSSSFYLILIRSRQISDESLQLRAYLSSKYLTNINPLDGFMRAKVCDPVAGYLLGFHWFASRQKRIKDAMYALVVSLADTQLVTGIAMLIAAIIKLNKGTISVYHLATVTNLAWFSSNVHLTALLAMRTHLIGSAKKHQRWAQAGARGVDITARVLSMLLIAALLLYCSYICGAIDLYDHYHCPAHCAIGKPKGGTPLSWTIVSFSLVVPGYLERCLLMWPWLSRWFIDKVRPWVLDSRAERNYRTTPAYRYLITLPYYFYNSETTSILLDGYIWFALGVYWTFDDRNIVHNLWQHSSNIAEENNPDGFGQLVPLLLIGVPFLSALDAYCEAGREAARERQKKYHGSG